MDVKIEESWKQHLEKYFDSKEFEELAHFIKMEYKISTVYPKGKDIFNAFNTCGFDKLKVVILGQDPYHGERQAHGYAFSVPENEKIPPSLQNIFKCLNNDLEIEVSTSGDLTRWAEQGVLLLNSILTVRANSPASHQKKGWEEFTDYVIKVISEDKEHVVFMLWGEYAQKKADLIDAKKHLILKTSHPSPYSASYGFLTCKHFSQTNSYLKKHKLGAIDW